MGFFSTILGFCGFGFGISIEFDALTGSKISSIDIGAPVVRMSYSPTSGHAVIAILEGLVCCIHLKRSQNKFLLIQKSILL
ncbi:hypothetical protein RGQ29_017422 [Quercus rubra]|uniref:Uncharacterized protein n=1 Tax=Quercus rubra TaxID=3512 RepID=A0AAN7FGX0_QUERU|nr:hypothetical protein RGQ29_017422 [Quercus rubra]